MFNELYKELCDLLEESVTLDLKYSKAPNDIMNLLTFEYGIYPQAVKRCIISKDETKNKRIFVLCDFNDTKYNDLILCETIPFRMNDIANLYIISYDAITEENEKNIMNYLFLIINRCVTDLKYKYIQQNVNSAPELIINKIFKYSSMIILISIAIHVYKEYYNGQIYKVLVNNLSDYLYGPSENTVKSAFKIIKEMDIDDLLDRGYILGADDDEYPELLFYNKKIIDEKE